VREGDTLCSIGACFNKDYEEIYRQNMDLIADPDVLYPGDR
jgi:hypothetical protein